MAELPLDEVSALLREVAGSAVLPLFRRLDAADIEEKAPGELVTVADREAERLIGARLRELLPGSAVVGEEAVAQRPELLRDLSGEGYVWLVDPVDGTANFAAGRRPFALMVALLRAGELIASWILDPLAEDLAVARLGTPTLLNGVPVRPGGHRPPLEEVRGVAATRFLPARLRAEVAAGGHRLGELLDGQHCAGREYLDMLTGAQQFVLFWRILPWDHAPGVLLVRCAGGVARHFDGSEYHPAEDRRGLLVAADEETWHGVRAALLPDQ
ncbi:inositol monophosphatase family protein [Plantactinospora sp. KBS50]|uniref:inositol monophosphatase family protein n=1 Tax=Plantactinospora sp. KBS50 TaxID=2024580 RepID=UPI000BAABE1D|nr:inositol monophosphatase family protein [Plantactinospora sp. KBS50]ASW56745.1 inositol monophosphatase [Plantactinospora sp. KBS50]